MVMGMVVCRMCIGCGQMVTDSDGGNGQGQMVQDYGIRTEYELASDDGADAEGMREILVTQDPEVTQKPAGTPMETQVLDEIQQPEKEGTAEIPKVTQSPVEKESFTTPMVTEIPKATQSRAEEKNKYPEITRAPIETMQSEGKESVPVVTQQPEEKETVPTVTQQPVEEGDNTVGTREPVKKENEEKIITAQPIAKPSATKEPAVHIHTLVTEIKEAACLSEGIRKEYCGICGEVVREESIPAKGHDFVKSVWELPTCMKGGYYNNICNRCGQVECVTQTPLPHEVEDILIQEGNCMEDTVIQHICKLCGIKVKDDTRYTPYDVHAWITALVDGAELTYCERCGVIR